MDRATRLKRDAAVDPIMFYRERNEWGEFSNFSRHDITLLSPWTWKPVNYRTGEHRFQAMKATNQRDHDLVVNCTSPRAAKDLGRTIKLRDDWGQNVNTICWYVMFETVLAKALQHEDVYKVLEATGERTIYEDSPVDDIWGWRYGHSYTGKNLLGVCWMQVRAMVAPSA